MKKTLLALGLAACTIASWGQVSPRPATLDQANAGVDTKTYITPYALQHADIVPGSGINATEGTNIAKFQTSLLLPMTTNQSITISAKGIKNSLSTFTNGGAMFGPDTVGTTTCGIQEAWNSASKGTEYGPTTAGARLDFGIGDFFFTNRLVFSNRFTSEIILAGKGVQSSRLIYAGTEKGQNLVLVRGGHNSTGGSLDIPMHAFVEKLTFTSLTQDTNILLCLTNCSAEKVIDCNFTSWQIMTNQIWGSQLSIPGGSTIATPGLVGLVIGNLQDHATIVRDCYFSGLSVGIHAIGDHFYGEMLKFAYIGMNNSPSWVSLWSSDKIYSVGACILRDPALDSHIFWPHFYTVNAGLVINNTSSQSEPIWMSQPVTELCDHLFAAADPANAVVLLDAYASHTTEWNSFKLNTSPYSYSASPTIPLRRLVYDGQGLVNGDTPAKINSTAYNIGPITWTAGSGSPEGAVTAPVGSFFSRTNGSTSTTWYVKETGTGNTGWVAK